jgi:ACS family glucarate transporter-like MFS transporter
VHGLQLRAIKPTASVAQMPPSATPLTHRAGSSRIRLRVLAFLCVLSFLTYYDRQCVVRAQADIQAALGITDYQLAVIFGVFWYAYAIFEIPGGWMGDKFGARLTLTRIVLAWSLFTALTGAATGFMSLFAYRFLFGVGEAGAYPNMARAQSRWFPLSERARAAGLLWLTARFGAAFAPIIFGKMTRAIRAAQLSSGSELGSWLTGIPPWRLAFVASGAFGLVWCVAFCFWFRDDPSQKPSVSASELNHIEAGRGLTDFRHHMKSKHWKSLFTSSSLWAIAVYYVCGGFGWSFFMSWMPRYMNDVQHVAFQDSEWASAWPLICGGIACFAGGFLSDALVKASGWRWLGRAIFPIGGCTVAAAAMLAIAYAHTPENATLCMCIASAAYDFGQAASWACVVDIGGRYAGVAAGFINIGCLGNALQPSIGAYLFHEFDWNVLFGVYAISFLLAATTWFVINPTRTFYDEKM